ncbi:CAP domain-containing protein [Protaetiibacter intestinalis]|uniref:CAP domain-containing protein n=1 Tax=Protaetiibacter intestinalis TaxID=2419774 RepID=A0A387BE43_9MICO|nr:CAP domain-containing protein [Protaetiibacter intestinalis]AYF99169.1 CAP domain-containing protein [Protaetiibacter intestinalis]
MGDSGGSVVAWWPAGRLGVLAAAVVVLLLAVGAVGGAAAMADASHTTRADREPVVDPVDPAPATPLPAAEPLAPKAAPSGPAVAASYYIPPAPVRSTRTRSGGSGGSGGGGSSAVGSSDVLSLTNARRAENGVGPLSSSSTLVQMACDWAAQMAGGVGLVHNNVRPPGARAWAENIAAGYRSASSVVDGWMNSSGHRANILNGTYTQMGACSADAADGTRYWVQKFAG